VLQEIEKDTLVNGVADRHPEGGQHLTGGPVPLSASNLKKLTQLHPDPLRPLVETFDQASSSARPTSFPDQSPGKQITREALGIPLGGVRDGATTQPESLADESCRGLGQAPMSEIVSIARSYASTPLASIQADQATLMLGRDSRISGACPLCKGRLTDLGFSVRRRLLQDAHSC
jgi:hypothetical protein